MPPAVALTMPSTEVRRVPEHPRRWIRWLVAWLPLLFGLQRLVLEPPGWSVAFVAALIDVALVPLAAFLVGRRHRRPLVVALVLTIVASLSPSSLGMWAWGAVSMATRRRWTWALGLGATTLVCATLAGLAIGTPEGFGIRVLNNQSGTSSGLTILASVVTAVICWAVLTALGFYVGARRELEVALRDRAETAEREHLLIAAAAKADERARLAREMHDVVAHRISVVAMHAGILTYREDLSPSQVHDLATIIASNANESLTELRTVLGVLREPGSDVSPQPTMADLTRLLNDVRAAGTTVNLDRGMTSSDEMPPTMSRHAYRIIQEALTNARKHACDEPVHIRLRGGPGGSLDIEVRNRLAVDSGVPGAGLGLTGLAERAALAGGRCVAGPEDGEFIVRAWLPWR